MSINIIFIANTNYNIKYSIDGDMVNVSIPLFKTTMNKNDGKINDELREKLNKYNWSDKSIDILEKKILFPKDGKYRSALKLNPSTGKISTNLGVGEKYFIERIHARN